MQLLQFQIADLTNNVRWQIDSLTWANPAVDADTVLARVADLTLRNNLYNYDPTEFDFKLDEAQFRRWVCGTFMMFVPNTYPGDVEVDIEILTEVCKSTAKDVYDLVVRRYGIDPTDIEEVHDVIQSTLIIGIYDGSYQKYRGAFGW